MLHMIRRGGLALCASALLMGCAHTPPSDPQDPFETVNRGVYAFNTTADHYVLRPIAQGYVDATPRPVRHGIGNFVDNIKYPLTIINDYLQFKFHNGTADLARFVINSTVGFAGFVDVASGLGLSRHDEDFGQTLGVWGLGQGVYLMLPFMGPTTGRDLTGSVADGFANPINQYADFYTVAALQALYYLDLRASLLGFDSTVENAFDPYLFVRSAYLQRRQGKVNDGKPPRRGPGGADGDSGS